MKEKVKRIAKWIKNNWVYILIAPTLIIVSFYTVTISYSYFRSNELFLKVSDKYTTQKELQIKEQVDTILINNVTKKDYAPSAIDKANDNNAIITSNNPLNTNYVVITSEKETFELGDIGDFIGGYFGFWIGVIGALLTFLAFYIQYRANKDVQKQFRLQQFETQFHKMIDVYLNNKDKFSIYGYKNPDNTAIDLNKYSGRMPEKLKQILAESKQKDKSEKAHNIKALSILSNNNFYFSDKDKASNFIPYTTTNHAVFQKFLVELKVIYIVYTEGYLDFKLSKDISDEVKHILFIESYKTFMYGLNKYKKEYTTYNKSNTNEAIKSIKTSLEVLHLIRKIHKTNGTKIFNNFYTKKEESKTLWVKLNYTPFQGYLHFLPQYYRNLYSIVKYVVNENKNLKLSVEDKLSYLRVLRSTMSDYEQTMLFYNWYSGFGIDWENKDKDRGELNNFFIEYKMIHNLKKITLIDEAIDIATILNIKAKNIKDVFENFD